uniref:Movement protein BC1 n=1 Tax=Pepper yellow vein Mali virus TaxID=260378 RepID=A0A5B8G588_9GEMI|nr:movement protein [Pepper yellow vein Mali virus]QDQ68934.1 movement protein [Pepper yellow vein Mali virus]
MESHYTVVNNKYIESQRNEYQLTNDATPIKLQFPSSVQRATSGLMGRCMKIDHIIIEYRNQVPFNATGSVIVEIRDHRISSDEAAQAAFTFPILCNVGPSLLLILFFLCHGSFHLGRFVYKVEDSNVVEGTRFASIKAKLRLSSAKHSTDIRFKPPTINILSKGFTKDCVDFWSVERGLTSRRLLNPNPSSARIHGLGPAIQLLPGETWATRSTIGDSDVRYNQPVRSSSFRLPRSTPSLVEGQSSSTAGQYPYRRLEKLDATAIDPGDSISQGGTDSISRRELTSIIESTINKCLITNVNNQQKHL